MKAVIFDLDGLLLDTERIHAQVYERIANRYDRTIPEAVQARLRGRRSEDSAATLIEAVGLPLNVEEFLTIRLPLVEAAIQAAPPMPGAVELVRSLHAAGVPQAIATSSNRSAFAHKTVPHRSWLDLCNPVICGDEPGLWRSKPAPDIFLIAAERLGVTPADCLVFEDAAAGIAAGKAAGMTVVAVPGPGADPDELAIADVLLDSLEQFDLGAWGLA